MRLRNGFLLYEVMLYGALALIGVMFFTTALNVTLGWRRQAQQTLRLFLYHYHALVVIQKDLSCCVSCMPTGLNTFAVSGTKLDAHWNEVPWRVIYECRKNRLFRKKITMPDSEQPIKSSIRLASAPEKLACECRDATYVVTYALPKHQAWQFFIHSLVRKEVG